MTDTKIVPGGRGLTGDVEDWQGDVDAKALVQSVLDKGHKV